MVRKLFLVEPDVSYEQQFQKVVHEYMEAKEEGYANIYKLALDDFPKFVEELINHGKGLGLPEGWVPGSTYWLTDETKAIYGIIRIRHIPLPVNGHIGYDVPPSERGKGYGRILLALGLEKAKDLKIEQPLLSCNRENIQSRRIIEANGGIFLEEAHDPEDDTIVRKYRIDLR